MTEFTEMRGKEGNRKRTINFANLVKVPVIIVIEKPNKIKGRIFLESDEEQVLVKGHLMSSKEFK